MAQPPKEFAAVGTGDYRWRTEVDVLTQGAMPRYSGVLPRRSACASPRTSPRGSVAEAGPLAGTLLRQGAQAEGLLRLVFRPSEVRARVVRAGEART